MQSSIGPSGATAFGQMLSTNTGLRRVDLRWNAMGPGGVEVLCAGLQKNTQISELLVAGNKATDDTLRVLERLLRAGVEAGPWQQGQFLHPHGPRRRAGKGIEVRLPTVAVVEH